MLTPLILNPDDFLGTPRIWTPERNRQAWEQCYARMEEALASAQGRAVLYVVCGLQGAGKSTWIRANAATLAAPAIILDAALPGIRHRARAITLAQTYQCEARAIWLCTPMTTALRWNRDRPEDQWIADEAILSVHEQFEEPTRQEGFHHIEKILPIEGNQ